MSDFRMTKHVMYNGGRTQAVRAARHQLESDASVRDLAASLTDDEVLAAIAMKLRRRLRDWAEVTSVLLLVPEGDRLGEKTTRFALELSNGFTIVFPPRKK